MVKIKQAGDLVKIEMTTADISLGINYGIISRAWTFDRMGAQVRGDFGKAIFRIAVGKAVQAAIERYLSGLGVTFKRDTTNYRTPDYWDISSGRGKSVDIKSFQLFSDYQVPGRSSLSASRIVSSTLGESWESFYPMLIPQDQFDNNTKDYYIFGILSAPMSKRCPYTHHNPRGLIALPYSKDTDVNSRFQKVHFANFATQRIRYRQMFDMCITHGASCPGPIHIVVGYADINGEARSQRLILNPGDSGVDLMATALHYLKWEKNECPPRNGILLEVLFHGVDNLGPLSWKVYCTSFEDVWIYPDELWCIGWIDKEAFRFAKNNYPVYGPVGNTNKRLRDKGGILHNGSFCYFYPPVAGGGTKNQNYYILPKDLNTIGTLFTHLN